MSVYGKYVSESSSYLIETTEEEKKKELVKTISNITKNHIKQFEGIKFTHSSVGNISNYKFRKGKSDTIVFNFGSLAVDVICGSIIGMLCPVVPIDMVSSIEIPILAKQFNESSKELETKFEKACPGYNFHVCKFDLAGKCVKIKITKK